MGESKALFDLSYTKSTKNQSDFWNDNEKKYFKQIKSNK